MKFTELFIRKPVFSIVVNLLILLVGIKSFVSLPVSQYPLISPSVISITTSYPGAPSELVEGFVTTPLENALGGIEGIDIIQSQSSQGHSSIGLQFKLGYDLTKAMANVSNAVASVRRQLPTAVKDPIIDTKDTTAAATLYIAFSSKEMEPAAISDYLSRAIQPQLQNIPGVSQAQILGSNTYAMRLWLDPQKMAAHHVTASDITDALAKNNVQAAPGNLRTAWEIIKISADTDLTTVEQFNNLIIKNKNNYLVRMSDVGHAALGVLSDQQDAAVNGNHAAIIMGIIPLPTANPLSVANAVKALLPQLQANVPSDIKINVVYDSSKFIAESIRDVKYTLFEACFFVFIVIVLFLGTLRATIIPLVTIPLSIFGVCVGMLIMGYSINTLTLLAWILAIGLVVDDAIVVLENIHRHIEKGLSPLEASLVGAKEIGFAIIAMTITLAAVYAPIGFINDMTGILFREFAFTLAGAVIISGVVALTLSPMMCSKLLSHSVKPWAFMVKVESLLNRLTLAYKKSLTYTLQHRKLVLSFAAIVYIACFGLFKNLLTELAPAEDQGVIITGVRGPTSANLPYMKKYMAQVENIYKSIPEAESYISMAGTAGSGASSGISFLVLKPWNARSISSAAIIESLFPRDWAIAGVQAFPSNPPPLPGSGSGHHSLNIVLKSTDSYVVLNKLAKELQIAATQRNPRIVGLQSDLNMDMKQIDVSVNKDKAIALGVSMSDIANSLNIFLGEPESSVFSWNGRSYKIIPQLYHNYMSASEQLKELYVRSSQSQKLIPLANFVTLLPTSSSTQSLNHFQQLRAVSLGGSLAPGYTVGEAVHYLQNLAKEVLPKTIQLDYAGATRQFMQSGGSMQQTFLFALLFIFLVLAAQFESFRAPFIILLTVPLSLAGALLALLLTGGTLNIYTQIGLVTLIGLITKHGILIVEFANQLKKQQMLLLNEAVIEAASLRLRPILMTTAAMILAAVPLAFANGAGAHARNQLGWVILGGMAIGTLFTLYILPAMYTLIYTKKKSVV